MLRISVLTRSELSRLAGLSQREILRLTRPRLTGPGVSGLLADAHRARAMTSIPRSR